MEKFYCRRGFEETLRQCQESIERFEGSKETLRYIQCVEASLKRLVAELNLRRRGVYQVGSTHMEGEFEDLVDAL